jgi:hypothetical protein
VCVGSALLLAKDESTSIVNGALVRVLLSQSASPSVVCLSSPRSTYLGFLIEGKSCCCIHHTFLLGFPTGWSFNYTPPTLFWRHLPAIMDFFLIIHGVVRSGLADGIRKI